MQHVMLDLETMGTGSNAAIVAIGAVEFDLNTLTIGESFYRKVDLQSSVESGGAIDASTVLWWMKQSDEVRRALYEDTEDCMVTLQAFLDWMIDHEAVYVWGNGAGFDNVILREAYKRLDVIEPWLFYNDRCYRTIKALRPDIKMERVGTHHSAIDDARSQALHLLEIVRAIRNGSTAPSGYTI